MAEPGTVVAWGWGLSTPDRITNAVAVSITGAGNPPSIPNALALLADGRVRPFGQSDYGLGSPPEDLTNAIAVAAGPYHSVAVRADGTVVCWGQDIGGDTVPPSDLDHVVAVSAGLAHSLALRADGSLRGWGSILPPVGLTNVRAIASGKSNSMALTTSGTVVAWGTGSLVGENEVPAGLSNAVAISTCVVNSAAVLSNGTVVAWGIPFGPDQALGGGTPIPADLTNVVAVAAGYFHDVVLLADHGIRVWGRFRTDAVTNRPAQLTNFTAVASGSEACAAITLQPVVFHEPASVSVPAGQDTQLSVDAAGSTDLSYQWWRNASPVSGATNATLILGNPQEWSAGDYWVHLSCAGGSIRSRVSTVTVIPALPTVRAFLGDLLPVAGADVTFHPVVSGTEPMFYQWWNEWGPIPGATNDTLVIYDVGYSTMERRYRLSVSNAVGVIPPTPIGSVFPQYPPALVTHPVDTEVPAGTTASFLVRATGDPPLRYQWMRDGVPISGATESMLRIEDVQAANQGRYSVVVSNLVGTRVSAGAQLKVNPSPPVILVQPRDAVAAPEVYVHFVVEATGTRPLRVQWRRDRSPIVGATNATLVLPDVQAADQGRYGAVIENDVGFVESAEASLQLYYPPSGGVDWPSLGLLPMGPRLLEGPTAISPSRDGSDGLVLGFSDGRVLRMKDGQLLSTPVLDLRGRVHRGPDRPGLVGLALPPDFSSERRIYAAFFRAGDLVLVLARYLAGSDGSATPTESEEVLLEVGTRGSICQGATLAFGGGGYLYLALGDEVPPSPSSRLSQDPKSLFGKLLRLEVASTARGYRVPSDNPFASGEGGRPEVWSLGLQNPSGLHFDPSTGDLYFADRGSVQAHEINQLAGGLSGGRNFGWPLFEGVKSVDGGAGGAVPDLVDPIYEFPTVTFQFPGEPWVFSGNVYRGREYHRMRGAFIFGDFPRGRLWAARDVAGRRQFRQYGISETFFNTTPMFGEDDLGNVYAFVSYDGRIHRIIDSYVAPAPILGLPAGWYYEETNVTISCDAPGAAVHYTEDGRDPTEADPFVVSGGRIPIRRSVTLKARAFRPDLAPGPVTRLGYGIEVRLRIRPSAGPVPDGTPVSISSSLPDTTIRYTLDGSDPNPESPLYAMPIRIRSNSLLKVIGGKDGCSDSGVITRYFGDGVGQSVAIHTIAGGAGAGFADGTGSAARFNQPQGLSLDRKGNVLVADSGNNRVRLITPDGRVSTLAGTGVADYRDGPAHEACFNRPVSVSVNADGDVFVADQLNHRIRKIDGSGRVSTLAGGSREAVIDGQGTDAGFLRLSQMAIDERGTLYVGDGSAVRGVSPEGAVRTIASIEGVWPLGLAWGADEGLRVTTFDGRVLRIEPASGTASLVMGGNPGPSDGAISVAGLDQSLPVDPLLPRYLTSDAAGNLYVADGPRVRSIDIRGMVRTMASPRRLGSGAPAPFGLAAGLCADQRGNLYVADAINAVIRMITSDADADDIPDSEEGGASGFVAGLDDHLFDFDGDGLSGAAEYAAGTNPRDASSGFAIRIANTGDGGAPVLSWSGMPDRFYVVQQSSHLVTWSDISDPLPGARGLMEFALPSAAPAYYRVLLTVR